MSQAHIVLLVACTAVCALSAGLCYWSVGVLRAVGSDVSKYLKLRIDEQEKHTTHPEGAQQ